VGMISILEVVVAAASVFMIKGTGVRVGLQVLGSSWSLWCRPPRGRRTNQNNRTSCNRHQRSGIITECLCDWLL
jgi:hypothetical protein